MLKSTHKKKIFKSYSSDFEPMITHQRLIPWIINKWNHALSSRVLILLMNHVLSLDTSSIRYSIPVLGLKVTFQHIKNHRQVVGKPQPILSIKIKY